MPDPPRCIVRIPHVVSKYTTFFSSPSKRPGNEANIKPIRSLYLLQIFCSPSYSRKHTRNYSRCSVDKTRLPLVCCIPSTVQCAGRCSVPLRSPSISLVYRWYTTIIPLMFEQSFQRNFEITNWLNLVEVSQCSLCILAF